MDSKLQKNYFKNYLKGNESLTICFWGYHILLIQIFGSLIHSSMIKYNVSELTYISVSILLFVFVNINSLATWRSARIYKENCNPKGKKFIGILAQILIILLYIPALNFIFNLIKILAN